MNNFWDRFHYSDGAAADENYVYKRNGVRVTVLTPYLLRIEKQRNSVFCDAPTQSVICRAFDKPAFTTEKADENEMLFQTEKCTFCVDFKSGKVRFIILDDGRKVTDMQGDNLKGTCRTLDGTNGKTKLGNGVVAKTGVAVLDDSDALVVHNNGTIEPRKCAGQDLYYFAYGFHYTEALYDYFRLTGFPPLIPRFALGNWWSRYKAYTQDEYIALMKKFISKKIPLTVATVDMDWHWVKVVEKFGKEALDKKDKRGILELFYNITNPGWTGYSWNTDLFPAPKEFLQWLKQHRLMVTVNLHPASGCKFYEDSYAEFCAFMGIDPATHDQIYFDITDKKFVEGYFRFLHHPHENDGVDFWWIDWQQGTKTKIPGLDPLWALNHYHYLDNARSGKRPLILSRYSGRGAHRYPLGFSGDTAQTWSTLAFQPYFTATASNIGYTWWSHDIGGHHFGERDDELYLRWVQFGVFSPILRLHSTSNEFMGKEPWKYRAEIEQFASQALRLRHRLIPYVYSMNRLTAENGIPLIRPMYHLHPQDPRAYEVPNQYYFGSELIVCPITEKTDPQTSVASVKVFLPEGRYTDIFNGRIYKGNCVTTMCRDISFFPVLAKEGAVIPLGKDAEMNDCGNPSAMELWIYRGNSSFVLYEDDGITMDYKNGAFAETTFCVEEDGGDLIFRIAPVKGCAAVIPNKRDYTLLFRDIAACEKADVLINGEIAAADVKISDFVSVALKNVTPADAVEISLRRVSVAENESLREIKTNIISRLQGSNNGKNRFSRVVEDDKNSTAYPPLKNQLAELNALDYPET